MKLVDALSSYKLQTSTISLHGWEKGVEMKCLLLWMIDLCFVIHWQTTASSPLRYLEGILCWRKLICYRLNVSWASQDRWNHALRIYHQFNFAQRLRRKSSCSDSGRFVASMTKCKLFFPKSLPARSVYLSLLFLLKNSQVTTVNATIKWEIFSFAVGYV